MQDIKQQEESTESWEERFDEKFDGLWLDGMHDYETNTTYNEKEAIEKLKSFIQSELELERQKAKEETLAMVLKEIEDWDYEYDDEAGSRAFFRIKNTLKEKLQAKQ